MTTWTDDELGDLLATTFRTRETDDDARDAQRVARAVVLAPRRRIVRPLLAAAASVAIIGGVTTYAVQHAGSTSDSNSSSAAGGAAVQGAGAGPIRPTSTASNIAYARAQAQALLNALPMPPGSVESRTAPPGAPSHDAFIGPSAYSRTTWWIVPGNRTSFAQWLDAHDAAGMRRDDTGGYAPSIGEASYTGPDSAATTPPSLLVGYRRVGDHVVVTMTSFTGARLARSAASYVSDVSQVTVARTGSGPHGSRAHRTVVTVTDRDTVAALTRLTNRLRGSMTERQVTPCPSNTTGAVTLTFATPRGTLVADLASGCNSQVALTRDGKRLGVTLDPEAGFFTRVTQIVDASHADTTPPSSTESR